jgi:hypothetical protein
MKTLAIVLGVLGLAIGGLLFIGAGTDHSACSSIFFAGSSTCQRVNAVYDGGIVLMFFGAVLLIVGVVTTARARPPVHPRHPTYRSTLGKR